MENQNGWHEWSRHVLAELKRLNKDIQKIDKRLQCIQVDLVSLKVKAGLIGAISATVITGLISFFRIR